MTGQRDEQQQDESSLHGNWLMGHCVFKSPEKEEWMRLKDGGDTGRLRKRGGFRHGKVSEGIKVLSL